MDKRQKESQTMIHKLRGASYILGGKDNEVFDTQRFLKILSLGTLKDLSYLIRTLKIQGVQIQLDWSFLSAGSFKSGGSQP